jgi:hypothetical protein
LEEYFHTALYKEEEQMQIDIQRYDMDNVILKKVPGGLFELEVPGLAEKR